MRPHKQDKQAQKANEEISRGFLNNVWSNSYLLLGIQYAYFPAHQDNKMTSSSKLGFWGLTVNSCICFLIFRNLLIYCGFIKSEPKSK